MYKVVIPMADQYICLPGHTGMDRIALIDVREAGIEEHARAVVFDEAQRRIAALKSAKAEL